MFSATVAALLAGKKLNAALLFTATFTDGTVMRLWTGVGDLNLGGTVYQGAGRLIAMDGLDASIGTTAPTATFKMSGVDAAIAALAVAERDLIVGAEIDIAVQIFGDGAVAAEWQPVDAPVGLGAWIGDQLTFDRTTAARSITLSALNYFASRSRPQGSYYSERDQQLRYPGDSGGKFMASLISKNINWP